MERKARTGRRVRALLLALLFEGGMGLVGLFGVMLTVGLPSLWRGVRAASVVWGLAGTIPLLLLFWVLLRSRWAPLVELRETLGAALGQLFAHSRPLDILVVSLMAGLGEELLFRGFVQAWFRTLWGTPAALPISSLLFGLAHFVSPAYALFAALAGLYFGALFELSGDLLAPSIAHGLYDFLAIGYYLYLRRPDGRREGEGGA